MPETFLIVLIWLLVIVVLLVIALVVAIGYFAKKEGRPENESDRSISARKIEDDYKRRMHNDD